MKNPVKISSYFWTKSGYLTLFLYVLILFPCKTISGQKEWGIKKSLSFKSFVSLSEQKSFNTCDFKKRHLKSNLTNNEVPDSAHMFKNSLNYRENYRVYYSYYKSGGLKSSLSYMYDYEKYNLFLTKEIKDFDENGNTIFLLKEGPKFLLGINNILDSTITELYREESSYDSNDRLVKKLVQDKIYQGLRDEEQTCFYNQNGYLDSIQIKTPNRFPSSNSDGDIANIYFNCLKRYYYNDNLLYYMIYKWNFNAEFPYYTFEKYSYNKKDSGKITGKYSADYNWDIFGSDTFNLSVFDSVIPYQTNSYQFEESFDSLNRIMYFKSIHNNKSIFSDYNSTEIYKAYYTYNKLGYLSDINFYTLTDSLSDTWKHIGKSSYYYTEKGNILYYEKRFYDERTGLWEIEESKTYYYAGIPAYVGIEKVNNKADNIKVFPNPAKDILYIQAKELDNACYTIYNIQGQAIEKGAFEYNNLNISGIDPGMYILKVSTGSDIYTARFIKD